MSYINAIPLDRVAYADDVDLMAESKEEVGQKVAGFRRVVARVGLTINKEKTKLMKVTRGEAFVEEGVECGGLVAEAVERFKYLGSIITMRNEMEVEVLARISAGTQCAAALRKCFTAS